MNTRVLLVDDEPRVLDGYRRNLRKQFEIHTAEGGHAGLATIAEHGPFAVVVSDYRMPEMNGVDFLSKVAEVSPKTIRMMLTGQADMEATIASINDGRVFRFLTKPCPPESLGAVLNEAVEHYRLVEAEKELLEQTLRQTVGVLIDVLGLIDPATHHHSVRVSDRVAALCEAMAIDGAWEYTLAATLSQLGMIALPGSVVEKYRRGDKLRPADQELMESHPESAHNLLERIPRLERVAKMVLIQHDPPGSRPLSPDDPDDEDRVAIGGHLLDVSLRYEQLLAMGRTPAESIDLLREGSGPPFRFAIIDALAEMGLGTANFVHREATLADLAEGMLLDAELRTLGGLLLLASGTQLTQAHLERVRRFSASSGVEEPIQVLIPDWD